MLPRSKRLRIEDVESIMSSGKSFHDSFIITRLLLTNKPCRFSVSVPKKIAKTAVSRNKLRRQVYSIVKKMESEINSGFDTFIIMKSGSEKLSFSDLTLEIRKIFVKSRLLK